MRRPSAGRFRSGAAACAPRTLERRGGALADCLPEPDWVDRATWIRRTLTAVDAVRDTEVRLHNQGPENHEFEHRNHP